MIAGERVQHSTTSMSRPHTVKKDEAAPRGKLQSGPHGDPPPLMPHEDPPLMPHEDPPLMPHRVLLSLANDTGASRNDDHPVLTAHPHTRRDFVHQPFEPELNWTKFSISLPQADIPTLHEALAAVSDSAYAALQEGLRCGAEHLLFSSSIGGFKRDSGRYDAFETMLAVSEQGAWRMCGGAVRLANGREGGAGEGACLALCWALNIGPPFASDTAFKRIPTTRFAGPWRNGHWLGRVESPTKIFMLARRGQRPHGRWILQRGLCVAELVACSKGCRCGSREGQP
eukprot:362245-Chlamydomonas_euryale.AAC.2